MQVLIQIFLFVVIFVSIFLPIFWIVTDRPNKWAMSLACAFAVIVSLAYSWRESITEITIPNVGTIKRAAKQATDDATEVSKIRKRMEEIQEQFTDKLDKTNDSLSRLEILSNLFSTIIEAQTDNREAFDRLVSLSNDATFPLTAIAKQAYLSVLMEEDGKLFIERSTPEWAQGVDPEKISIDQLITEYWKIENVFNKVNILGYIWKRDIYSKMKKMDFLMQVMCNDKSIKCVKNAAYYFNKEAKLTNLSPLIELIKYKEWWDTNKEKYN
jgi:hypothetical protein